MPNENVNAPVTPIEVAATPVINGAPTAPTVVPQVDTLTQLAEQTKLNRRLQMKFQADKKAMEDTLTRERAAIMEEKKKYETGYISRDMLKNDPLRVLQEMGLNPQQIAEVTQRQTVPLEFKVRDLEEKLTSALSEIESSKKAQVDGSAQAYEQAVNQVRMEADFLIKSAPAGELDLIKESNATESIVELIKNVHASGIDGVYPKGYILKTAEAAKIVEDYLTTEALRLSNLPKVKAKLGEASAALQAESPEAAVPKKSPTKQFTVTQREKPQQLKTLTNTLATTTSAKPSFRDKRSELIAKYNGGKGSV